MKRALIIAVLILSLLFTVSCKKKDAKSDAPTPTNSSETTGSSSINSAQDDPAGDTTKSAEMADEMDD